MKRPKSIASPDEARVKALILSDAEIRVLKLILTAVERMGGKAFALHGSDAQIALNLMHRMRGGR